MASVISYLPNIDFRGPYLRNHTVCCLKGSHVKLPGCHVDASFTNKLAEATSRNVGLRQNSDMLQYYGSYFAPFDKCISSARSPLIKMVSNGYIGGKTYKSKTYTRLHSCLVISPPNGRKPSAIVKFLGGAFIGAVPEVTYSNLMSLLAKEGFLIISVPYNVTFDHTQAAREVYERFNSCLDTILTSGLPHANLTTGDLVQLPVYSVGHSNGALLQLLTGSYFSEKLPKVWFSSLLHVI